MRHVHRTLQKGEPDPVALLDDPEALALWRQYLEATEDNPLLGYFPSPKQQSFHESPAGIRAFFGGNRSGKTHCTVADDLIQAVDADALPGHLIPYKRWDPPFRCWIGCPGFDKLGEALIPKLRELTPRDQLLGKSFDKAYDKTNKVLRFANGSWIGFKTYDQDVDAYSSASLHRMHWDEEPEGDHGHAIRQEARARLIDTNGDELFSMTPLLGLSFVFDEIAEKADGDRIFAIRASMDDNPHLDRESKEAFRAMLTTDEEYLARYEGQFVHFKGLVFDEFTDQHVVDPPDAAHVRKLETIVGIDPGYRTTAVVFVGFDKENTALVYEELYLHKDDALPGATATQIKIACKRWGVSPDWFYIDPMARNASLQTGRENIQAAYQRAGIPVIEGDNKVEAGILEMKGRLQSTPPALLVSKRCTNWLAERGRYRVDDQEDGRFKVVKSFDHLMDATRYVCQARAWYQPYEPPRPQGQPSFDPNYQRPYREERPPNPNNPPLGSFS